MLCFTQITFKQLEFCGFLTWSCLAGDLVSFQADNALYYCMQCSTFSGSAQQAQPTIATVAHNSMPVQPQVTLPTPQVKAVIQPHQQATRVPVVSAPVMQQNRVPILPQIVVQAKVETPPVPQQMTVKQPDSHAIQSQEPQQPPQTTQVQAPPKAVITPPPSTTPSAVPVPSQNSSPPGVGPTYTHSETGTVPPVFHYMPAPPTDIVQDNSPESFTKLW